MKVKVTVLVSFLILLSSCKFHRKTKNYYETPTCSDSFLSDQSYIRREIQKIGETIPPLLELLPPADSKVSQETPSSKDSDKRKKEIDEIFGILENEGTTDKQSLDALEKLKILFKDNSKLSKEIEDWEKGGLNLKGYKIVKKAIEESLKESEKKAIEKPKETKFKIVNKLEIKELLSRFEKIEMTDEQTDEVLKRLKALLKDHTELLVLIDNWEKEKLSLKGYRAIKKAIGEFLKESKKEVIEKPKKTNPKYEAFKDGITSLQGALEKQSQECETILGKYKDLKGCRIGDTPYDKIYIQMDCGAVKKADDDIKSVLKSMNESDLKQMNVGEAQKILRTFLKLTGKQK